MAKPTVTGVAPAIGATGGGPSITITGSNFAANSTVKFGDVVVSTIQFDSSTQIRVTAPQHAEGNVDVSVNNADGWSDVTFQGQFFFQLPTISGIAPSSGPTVKGISVNITGGSFTLADEVFFGSTSAAFTLVNPQLITATTPPTSSVPVNPGTVDVRVHNPYGTSALCKEGQFTYESPIINPGSTSPFLNDSGPTDGGTDVTINGKNFADATYITSVDFGSTPGTILSATDTQIVVRSPQHVAGGVDVIVRNASGSSAVCAADRFFFRPPTIGSYLSPNIGPKAGGMQVTINAQTNSSFLNVTGVRFGNIDIPASQFISKTATQIVVLAPSVANGGTVNIKLYHALGDSTPSLYARFFYMP